MHEPTVDLRIRAATPLPVPAQLERELPLDDAGADLVARRRSEVAAIMGGTDDRLLVVVGPCSIHDPAAAGEYAGLLRGVADRYQDDLLVVMRVYFEKPRTVTGWKGLINDPRIDGSYQIDEGLRLARRVMVDVVKAGLGVATEFLDTTLGQYYADLVSWAAIGARTVESQVHRELASGLSMPVGFKNRTDGDIQVAVDAVRSARNPHWFPSLTRDGAPAALGTTGNRDTHVVLRGGTRGTNFEKPAVQAAAMLLLKHGLPTQVMVDCSHANSGKDPDKQPLIAANLGEQVAGGSREVAAVMLESNLLGGAQSHDAKPLLYGRSITDACLSWEQTLPVFACLAQAARTRRLRH